MKHTFYRTILSIILCAALSGCAEESTKITFNADYMGQNPPVDKPIPFAPGVVSTKDHKENGCAFSPDGSEFYFSRIVNDKLDIYVMYLNRNGWSKPSKLFNSLSNDFEPYVTLDNRMLFYTRSNHKDTTFSSGIWYVNRIEDGWSEPVYFSKGMYVSTANNGNIYYSGMLANGWISGQIEMRIFDNNQFGKPIELDEAINSPSYELHPCISHDESYIIFVSRRTDGRETTDTFNDLYISFKSKENRWKEPYYLGNIFGKSIRMAPYLSPDGKYLFFTMESDIYWVSTSFIEKLRNNL